MALVQKMKHLDIIGILLFIPSVLMLLLAVQWGGHRYAWKSATIIGLFIGAGGMIIVFGAWEWRQQEEASIPPRIIRNKNLLFAALLSLVVVGSMNLVVYYMPIVSKVAWLLLHLLPFGNLLGHSCTRDLWNLEIWNGIQC